MDKVREIPKSYDGVMGVPITFLDNYNKHQYEIVGMADTIKHVGIPCICKINGKECYKRILIRRIKDVR